MTNNSYLSPAAFNAIFKGHKTSLVVLRNHDGMETGITNYGARLVYLLIKDKQGKRTDVINGFDSIKGYLNSSEVYYGCCVGRFANRIKGGQFSLHRKNYQLSVNNGPNHLHGGEDGFHNQVWEFVEVGDNYARMEYTSPDMEEGYPGEMKISVSYKLNADNCLAIMYEAITNKSTILNITNHSYFNLNGFEKGNILNHHLWINATTYTPIDNTGIPLGTLEPVINTPFDFRNLTYIGKRINDDHLQLLNGQGYDHNYVLTGADNQLKHAAKAIGDLSNIVMNVYTTQPGLQFYSGNFMRGDNVLKGGATDKFRSAFCLETQHFPDSINHPSFPPVILNPGVMFKSETRYCFT